MKSILTEQFSGIFVSCSQFQSL